jgi:GDP-D-mannose dehydratase
MAKALIAGITGQDGSYLAEFLSTKVTFEIPESTADVVATGTIRLLRSDPANGPRLPVLSGVIE